MKVFFALLCKQCKDSLHNFQALMVMLVYPAVAFVMMKAMPGEPDMRRMFVTMFATMHGSFAPLVVSSNILAEEREKGTLRALLMAGVGRVHYLMSAAFFVVTLTMLTGASFLLMDMDSPSAVSLPRFAAAMLCGAVISTLIGLCVGICSRNVAAANGAAVPIGMFFALTPMLARFNDSMEKMETVLFSGQMSRLLEGGALTWEAPTVMALYAAALSVLLVLLFKKKGLA